MSIGELDLATASELEDVEAPTRNAVFDEHDAAGTARDLSR